MKTTTAKALSRCGAPALLAAASIGVAVLTACSTPRSEPRPEDVKPGATSPATAPSQQEINPRLLRRFAPMGAADSVDAPAMVALGRALFHDPRLSESADISCSSCHDLARYGVDQRRTSIGVRGQVGDRNAPTVLNATAQFSQFWDGRAATAEEQATGPILNPAEMGMPSAAAVVARLRGIPGYGSLFRSAFPNDPDPINLGNVGRSLASFERRLTTPSRWDRYLQGDQNALSAAEKDGLRTFLNVGCMVCHTGSLLGGSTFERVGVVEPWPNQKDTGRAKITGSDSDRMMFKVPTLRNITETGPYFHDGSGDSLPNAIRMMGRHQLGIDLTDVEVESIKTWMGSLRGELSPDVVQKPKLPE